jgi:hypothetical protein
MGANGMGVEAWDWGLETAIGGFSQVVFMDDP